MNNKKSKKIKYYKRMSLTGSLDLEWCGVDLNVFDADKQTTAEGTGLEKLSNTNLFIFKMS